VHSFIRVLDNYEGIAQICIKYLHVEVAERCNPIFRQKLIAVFGLTLVALT